MRESSTWHTTPVKSRVIFLLAVFFVFAGIAFANDIIAMGRQPALRLGSAVLLSGFFAVGYACGGVILRHQFWKVFFPLFVVQMFIMAALSRLLPDAPPLVQLNAAETQRLNARLGFDGTALIICVCLGYAGFVYVSVREARRYVRVQTEKASLDSEMAAAREVQRVMVPEDLPPIPGYAVESVYRPAAEVGGDFFQVIPLKSGRTLVVIGDVSGKGLRAAMIVSMIVGMLRTMSGFTEEPAEILGDLNRRLCGRMHGGFATCLAVRVDEDGRLALANAGHPPPYLNGMEFPIAGSMPLGLVETTVYEQATMDMRAGDRVVLLTDGIAEAQDAKRVLLGFTRVESLLRDGASAHTVAETAQRFGQQDDLTVISIAREA